MNESILVNAEAIPGPRKILKVSAYAPSDRQHGIPIIYVVFMYVWIYG